MDTRRMIRAVKHGCSVEESYNYATTHDASSYKGAVRAIEAVYVIKEHNALMDAVGGANEEKHG